MPGLSEMPMCSQSMSAPMAMPWLPIPGQTWVGAAGSFLGMWVAMMVAMMLPSLLPMLWRYRQAVAQAVATTGKRRLDRLTALVGAGYFLVWAVLGVPVFALGAVLAAAEMQRPALARIVPMAAATVVLIAGTLQFTAWKAHRLACCRAAPGCSRPLRADARTAWRHGMRLGLQCACCCGNLMAILLAVGVMDLRAMAVVTAAIAAERLAPAGERVAHATGAISVAVGLLLTMRAASLA
jgi:predicted metal-binding membrane protein